MSRADLFPSSTRRPGLRPDPSPEANAEIQDSLAERLAARVLDRGRLTLALVLLATGLWLLWTRQYLTWPWWSDHDVFATLALGWDRGQLPYRDLLANNFPGTIYLFWVLGRLAGWGQTWAFQAFDAGLVVVLGMALLAWSQRRFGQMLPGAVGLLAFICQYGSLDYTQTGQRDWHGPLLTALALVAAEWSPSRRSVVASGLLTALAWTVRPQTLLLWPAIALALVIERSDTRQRLSALGLWGMTLGLGVLLGFSPLIQAGLLGDFVTSVRNAAIGGGYYRVTAASFLFQFGRQFTLEFLALLGGVGLLLGTSRGPILRSGLTWLVALAGVLLYRPLSPCPHAYLDQPRWLIGHFVLALLIALMTTRQPGIPRRFQLAAVLALVAAAAPIRPLMVNLEPRRAMLEMLRFGLRGPLVTDPVPSGYRNNPAVPISARYCWFDYQALTTYLREQAGPDARIANLLAAAPALSGPAGRPTALPAESLAWLLVRPDALPAFTDALAASGPATLVVWSPDEQGRFVGPQALRDALQQFAPIVREHFEFQARFGDLEVWRHRDRPSDPAPAAATALRTRSE